MEALLTRRVGGADEFSKCCNLIEKQWDSGGDGSIHMSVKPKAGGLFWGCTSFSMQMPPKARAS